MALTRAAARRAEVLVVIDVLRATSTIVQALDAGYQSVLCTDGLERARKLSAPGRILAGEHGCLRPPGFDLGNSPAETTRPLGPELVLATTNGTPTVVSASALTPVVLVASLLNLEAVTEEITDADAQIVCSGADGGPAIEDIYVAGRLVARTSGPRSDAALAAAAVAARYSRPRDALVDGPGARALIAQGLGVDVSWCARESVVDLVPRVGPRGDGIACVEVGHSNKEKSNYMTQHLARSFCLTGLRWRPR